MFIVVLEYPKNLPEVIGPFNSLNEADDFEKEMISKIKSSEYKYKEISPANYLHPIDGYYIADFNPEYHPNHHPIRMKAMIVINPSEINNI